MRKLLVGLVSPETALCQDYPFGSGRCIRRVWFEQGKTGSTKGQFRMMAQTTVKADNAEYNNAIREQGKEAAFAMFEKYAKENRLRWNKPVGSTYALMMFPYLDAQDHIQYDYLSYSSGQKDIARLRDEFYNQLPPEDKGRFDKIAAFLQESRNMGPFEKLVESSLSNRLQAAVSKAADPADGVMNEWLRLARKLLAQCTGESQEDFGYRAYLRSFLARDTDRCQHLITLMSPSDRETRDGAIRARTELLSKF